MPSLSDQVRLYLNANRVCIVAACATQPLGYVYTRNLNPHTSLRRLKLYCTQGQFQQSAAVILALSCPSHLSHSMLGSPLRH